MKVRNIVGRRKRTEPIPEEREPLALDPTTQLKSFSQSQTCAFMNEDLFHSGISLSLSKVK